ncbi:hypothetical protein [Nocardioides sp. L-11A]|uniref:hypothetical protein n=1 Tax=Nocardioides sp. L-11A TaxID=3043848 RepID=UPI002499BDC2|nr:hypothetical protein QJ852_17035 [Nocardioides sp. L-11A]
MKHTSVKKTALALGVGLSATATVTALALAPASATTTSNEWNLASNGVDASGKSFTGEADLVFTGTFNGAPATVTCTDASGVTYTAPDPTPHAPELDTMSIQVTPPATFPTGSCVESVQGGEVTVTTNGQPWTLTFETPEAPPVNSAHFTGTLTGSLSVPANSVTAVAVKLPGINNNLTPPCKLVGPTSALSVPGSYTGSTGVATKTGGGVSMTLNNTDCPRAGTAAVLQSASATLWEVGATSNHPDLLWVP